MFGTPQSQSQPPVTDFHLKYMHDTGYKIKYSGSSQYTARKSLHLFILHNGTSLGTAAPADDQARVWLNSNIMHYYTDE